MGINCWITKWKRYWLFYWHSNLSIERQSEIRTWLDTLSDKEFRMLEDLVQDAKDEARYDESYDNEGA
jgi:hypothetical protein